MKHVARIPLLLIFIAVLPLSVASAQEFFGKLPGPEGGRTYAVECAANGDALCLTQTRIYRAAASGGGWQSVQEYWIDVNNKKFHRAADGTLYACAVTAGLYVSTDNGLTWVKNTTVNGFCKDVLTAAGTLYHVGEGVQASTDGGVSWEERNAGIEGLYPVAIAALPDGTLFLSDPGGGIFQSTNEGAQWTAMTGSPLYMFDLFVDAAGTLWACGNDGLYRTKDRGATWEHSTIPNSIRAISADPAGALYACGGGNPGGIYRSTDGGDSWMLATVPDGRKEHASLAFASDGTGYCATAVGVLRSPGAGQPWEWTRTGMTSTDVLALAELPNGDLLASINSSGLYRSTDHGTHWDFIETAMDLPYVTGLRVTGDTVFALTSDLVYRSLDRGATWTILNEQDRFDRLSDMWIDPSGLYAGCEGAVRYSDDGGTTWQTFTTGVSGVAFTALLRIGDGTFFAAAGDAGVYASSDAGRSWSAAGDFPPGTYTRCLATDGRGTVYAGTSRDGLLRSSDGGTRWLRMESTAPMRNLYVLASDAAGRIYGASSAGCSYLEAGSHRWVPLSGFPYRAAALLVDSRQVLYAGSFSDGIYASIAPLDVDAPATPLQREPANGSVNTGAAPKLVWDETERALFYRVDVTSHGSTVLDTVVQSATMQLRGLEYPDIYMWRILAGNTGGDSDWSEWWTFDTGLTTGVEETDVSSFALQPAYPNPSTGSTLIPFRLSERTTLRLELHDVLGTRVRTLYEGTREPGAHRFPLSTAGLPPGVYYLCLRTPSGARLQPLTVLR